MNLHGMNFWRRSVRWCAVLLLLGLLVCQPTPQQVQAANYWTIRSAHSGKCLQPQGGSSADGAAIVQWDCGAGNHQLWSVDHVGDGYYIFRNYATGKCVDILNNSNNIDVAVHQWTCYNTPYQQWAGTSLDSRGYRDVNRGSGKCLDLYGESTSNGGIVVQWDCHDGSNQRWTFVPA